MAGAVANWGAGEGPPLGLSPWKAGPRAYRCFPGRAEALGQLVEA